MHSLQLKLCIDNYTLIQLWPLTSRDVGVDFWKGEGGYFYSGLKRKGGVAMETNKRQPIPPNTKKE